MKVPFYFKHTTIALLAGLTSVAVTAKTTTTSTASNTSNVTVAAPAVSQPSLLSPDYSHTWWFNLGYGAGGATQNSGSYSSNNSGPAGELSFNYATTNHQLFSLRATGVSQGFANGGNQDVGVLYGVMNKTDQFMASLSGGLAYTSSIDNPTPLTVDSSVTKNTLGLPLETQLFWTPTKYVGLGVIGFGNINSTRSFGGVLLAIQLGKLK
jgi:hypothetical protein